MEPLNQKITKITFPSTLPATLRSYANIDWKSRVCSRCKLWIYRFVKKHRHEILVYLCRLMWRRFQIKSVCCCCYCWKTSFIEYYLHQAQTVSSKQTWARQWAPEHAHCFLQIGPWFDASQSAQCATGARTRASLLVSRRNICSHRLFNNWCAATNRRFLRCCNSNGIHSLKVFYPVPAEKI